MSDRDAEVLSVLHLEDNPTDAELIRSILEEEGIRCHMEVVKSRKEYNTAIGSRNFDLIISDFSLPSFNGKEALLIAKERAPETPFIYVSGTIGEDAAIQALLDGATDYVLKTKLSRLVPAVRRAIKERNDRRKLKLAEKMREMALEDLKESEAKYRGLLESAPDAVVIVNAKGSITFVNDETERTFGFERDELIGKPLNVLVPSRFRRAHEELVKSFATLPHARALSSGLELYGCRKDGSEFPADIMLSPLTTDHEMAVLAMIRDMTEMKKAEKALRESEEKFRTIYEASPLGIVSIDEKGRFIGCNPAAAELFGYSEGDLLEMSFTDITYADDMEIGLQTLRELVNRKATSAKIEKRYIRKDGSIMLAQLTVSAVRNDLGRFRHAVTIVEDVTERREAEEALLRSEEQYRSLVDGARDAIFSLSNSAVIQSLNPAFEAITDWQREEWIGKSLTDLIHPEDRERAIITFQKVNRGEAVEVSQYRIKKKSGEYLIGEFNATARMRDGRVIGVLGIARDVTAQRNLEEQLRQSQKLESLGTLAGGIAHDFNNILGIINGYTGLLRRHVPQNDKASQFLDSIESASNRAVALVRQLLTFARKEERDLDYINVNDIILEISKLLSETFPKTITMSVEAANGLMVVYGDRSEIHQLILNLCVNARDAMMDRNDAAMAGGILRIRTGLTKGEVLKNKFPSAEAVEYVELSVSDTGVGMDEQTRSRIFEPFFTTKPEGKGTGLGLSTVYGIVQSHNGLLDVESKLGAGTTFSIYFPARLPASRSKELSEKDTSSIRGGEETILVVEDEAGLREYLADILSSEGYKVIAAGDGQRAIALLLDYRNVSLVLSDVGLPKIGGIDLVGTIQRMNPKTKVILASGFVEESERKRMMEKGVKAFIQKPYDRIDLLRKIRTVLDEPG